MRPASSGPRFVGSTRSGVRTLSKMASLSDDPLGTALDELFGTDAADFVAARNQIAARLRSAGLKAEAKSVLAARRPTAAAAALNRLAREQPILVTDFLTRSVDLRDSFRVSREEVRTATAAHREALSSVTDAALALLPGRSDTYRGQIQSTLHAAGIAPAVAQLLRAGRLEKEMTGPSGFAETELADPPDADGTPSRPSVRHLRLAPAPGSDGPASTTQRSATADERRRADSERVAREANEREREERAAAERDARRVEQELAEARWAQLHAAFEAAETDATDAAAELDVARRIETDLEAQLQAAQDRRQHATAQHQQTRANVASLRAQLGNKDGPDAPDEETSV